MELFIFFYKIRVLGIVLYLDVHYRFFNHFFPDLV